MMIFSNFSDDILVTKLNMIPVKDDSRWKLSKELKWKITQFLAEYTYTKWPVESYK